MMKPWFSGTNNMTTKQLNAIEYVILVSRDELDAAFVENPEELDEDEVVEEDEDEKLAE